MSFKNSIMQQLKDEKPHQQSKMNEAQGRISLSKYVFKTSLNLQN